MTDPIADALIRIKNGYMARKNEVVLPYSKLILAICEVLEKEGYVLTVKKIEEGKNSLNVTLRYDNSGSFINTKPALSEVKRVSKPGLRVYKNKKSLPFVLNGLGIALISTPKGVMTDKQARKEGVGGEVLAYVW